MKQKAFKECCGDVAVKYGLGKTLVTGHKASYWTEAAENYADQFKNLPDSNNSEKILCAAIWLDNGKHYLMQPKNISSGIVVAGLRHTNCKIILMSWLYPNWQKDSLQEQIKNEVNNKEVQGFITNTNRFVNRTEAATIFVNSGGTLKYHSNQLFSEDLY